MKYFFSATFLYFLFAGQLKSQQVVAASGGYYTNTQGTLSVTIGEPVIQTTSTVNLIITQGFQQPNTSSIVPLQLISFTGTINKGTIGLQWTTLNEIDVLNYTVERSFDAMNFEWIKTVNAKNTNVNTGIYNETDIINDKNIIYYRLKIKEKNGNVFYSWILKLSQNNESIKIYPVPVINQLNINITVAESTQKQLIIFDALGKTVFTQNVKLQKGSNSIGLTIGHLSAGTYFLTGLDDRSYQLIKE